MTDVVMIMCYAEWNFRRRITQ